MPLYSVSEILSVLPAGHLEARFDGPHAWRMRSFAPLATARAAAMALADADLESMPMVSTFFGHTATGKTALTVAILDRHLRRAIRNGRNLDPEIRANWVFANDFSGYFPWLEYLERESEVYDRCRHALTSCLLVIEDIGRSCVPLVTERVLQIRAQRGLPTLVTTDTVDRRDFLRQCRCLSLTRRVFGRHANKIDCGSTDDYSWVNRCPDPAWAPFEIESRFGKYVKA